MRWGLNRAQPRDYWVVQDKTSAQAWTNGKTSEALKVQQAPSTDQRPSQSQDLDQRSDQRPGPLTAKLGLDKSRPAPKLRPWLTAKQAPEATSYTIASPKTRPGPRPEPAIRLALRPEPMADQRPGWNQAQTTLVRCLSPDQRPD